MEPVSFATSWAAESAKCSTPLDDYAAALEIAAQSRRPSGSKVGDPQSTREAILRIVDATQPPLRVFLGSRPLTVAQEEYERRLATWQQWSGVSALADR